MLRLMAVAIVALSSLCACHDCEPPYMDDPTEVAEKTKILTDYLQSHDEVNICINGEQFQYYGYNYDEFRYAVSTFRSSEVRIEGQLIYFGTKIVLRVAQFTHFQKYTWGMVGELIFFSTK